MKKKLLGCFSIVILSCTVVFGDATFSNLGPNDEFDPTIGYLIGRFPDGMVENSHLGFQFTATVTGTINSVDVAVSQFDGKPNEFMTFTIWDDEFGLPGNSLWTGLTTAGPASELVNVTSAEGSSQTLIAGESYWLSSRSATGDAAFAWAFNSIGSFGQGVFDLTGGTNWGGASEFEQAAFRVNVNVESIPEPTILLPLALMALFASRRSRLK